MRRRRHLQIVGSGRDLTLRLAGDGKDDALDGLCETARAAGALDKLQRHLVQQARAAGRSWTEIGASLGISKQSAWERFSVPPD
jgi:hypothetical protein